eukprot:TRINITY_DN1956_c0_g1_i2.p1 TRINITY_DN1956_c0_g1~~TRINITY_DN1956_c0_g1_i2.p1  ORF type:complete len:116 (+),score=17.23 TRINITY_DN1956_c0_g1_i2:480-827(+)
MRPHMVRQVHPRLTSHLPHHVCVLDIPSLDGGGHCVLEGVPVGLRAVWVLPLELEDADRSSSPYSALIPCLLYTSDAADEEDSVDLGGRRIIKKKKIDKNDKKRQEYKHTSIEEK